MTQTTPNLAIITGSTRPGPNAEAELQIATITPGVNPSLHTQFTPTEAREAHHA